MEKEGWLELEVIRIGSERRQHLNWLSWAWKMDMNLKMEMGWGQQAEQKAAVIVNQRAGLHVNEGSSAVPSWQHHSHAHLFTASLPFCMSIHRSPVSSWALEDTKPSRWPDYFSNCGYAALTWVLFYPFRAREAINVYGDRPGCESELGDLELITYSWQTFSELYSLQNMLTSRILFDSLLNSGGWLT